MWRQVWQALLRGCHRSMAGRAERVLTRAYISWRGRRSDLPRNPVLLYRFDYWNWRLPLRRMQENRSRAVALLGDRGRRARKKDNTAKALNVAIRFTRTNPFVTALGTAGQPKHSLADFIGLCTRGRWFRHWRATTTGSVVDYANGVTIPIQSC
jgi:hypothetical protein